MSDSFWLAAWATVASLISIALPAEYWQMLPWNSPTAWRLLAAVVVSVALVLSFRASRTDKK